MTGDPHRAKILLVDDKRENLVALEAILEAPEYELITAGSGKQALEIALREPLTVILLDVVMPEMDGYEVAIHLKQLERTRDIPILFLTALATDIRHIYRAYQVGAVDYLIKPLDSEVVRRKVRIFVDLVRQREEIARQARVLREADRREHDLKMAELRIANDRRYRKLIEGIHHAIGWTADATLTLTFVSAQAARILGYPPQAFLEPRFWETLLHPDDRDDILAMFRDALARGTDLAHAHRVVTGEGSTAWFHTAVSGERGQNGTPPELHGISLDITELERAREEAKRLTKAREDLLAIVSHDLRTPLTSIRLVAETLELDDVEMTREQVQRSAHRILKGVRNANRLIADLLDYAQLQVGTLTVTHDELDVPTIVDETIDVLAPVAADKQLSLVGQVDEELRIVGDRDRLVEILSNLVGNAIKFTPPGGSITIRVTRVDRHAVFSVTDTGPGIAEEDLAQIWDRFWQADRRDARGVGLGLSITKGLVEAHGGQIWVESTPGVGTSFHFTIPLVGEVQTAASDDSRIVV